MQKENIISLVVIIIIALVVGGGVYWWQQSIFELEKSELLRQIDSLKNQLNLQQKVDLESQKEDGSIDIMAEVEKKKEATSIRLTAPNGGESLCLDDTFIVRWEHEGLSTVNLVITEGLFMGTSYPLGIFPADFNETGEPGTGLFVWKVGETSGGIRLKDGDAYHMIITGTAPVVPHYVVSQTDSSDNIFSILRCEG